MGDAEDVVTCLFGLVLLAVLALIVVALIGYAGGLFFGSHNCIYIQCATQHLSGGLRVKSG